MVHLFKGYFAMFAVKRMSSCCELHFKRQKERKRQVDRDKRQKNRVE